KPAPRPQAELLAEGGWKRRLTFGRDRHSVHRASMPASTLTEQARRKAPSQRPCLTFFYASAASPLEPHRRLEPRPQEALPDADEAVRHVGHEEARRARPAPAREAARREQPADRARGPRGP